MCSRGWYEYVNNDSEGTRIALYMSLNNHSLMTMSVIEMTTELLDLFHGND
jgi:hypothetical protein